MALEPKCPGPAALGPVHWPLGVWPLSGTWTIPYDLVRLNLLNEMREDTYNYDYARYVNFHVHVDARYHSNI